MKKVTQAKVTAHHFCIKLTLPSLILLRYLREGTKESARFGVGSDSCC